MIGRSAKVAVVLLAVVAVTAVAPSDIQAADTTRVSRPRTDAPRAHSHCPSMSLDGRRVVFESRAALVDDDTDRGSDSYLWDRSTDELRLLRPPPPLPAPLPSLEGAPLVDPYTLRPLISGDGRWVVLGGSGPLHLLDVETGDLQRIATSGGALAVNHDGRLVLFTSTSSRLVEGDTNGTSDVFTFDRVTGGIERVNVGSDGAEAGAGAHQADLASDAPVVVFATTSSLVPEDRDGALDVYLRDLELGTTTWVTRTPLGANASAGSHQPVVSGDGRRVAFRSSATDLGPSAPAWSTSWIHDRASGSTTKIPLYGSHLDLSVDGRFAAIAEEWGYGSEVRYAVLDLLTGAESEIDQTWLVTSVCSPPVPGAVDHAAGAAPVSLATVRQLTPDDVDGVTDVYLTSLAVAPCPSPRAPTNEAHVRGPQVAPGWFSSDVTVGLAAEDGCRTATAWYRVDGGPPTEGYTVEVSGSGPHTVEHWAVSRSGEVGPVQTLSFGIDLPPATSAVVSGGEGDNGWHVGTAFVALSAEDDLDPEPRTEWRPSTSATWRDHTGPIEVTATTTLEFRSIDSRGNVEPTRRLQVLVDRGLPTVTITRPKPGHVYWGTVESRGLDASGDPVVIGSTYVRVHAVDHGSGLDRIVVLVDGEPLCEAEPGDDCFWAAALDGPGDHVVSAFAVDRAGNRSPTKTQRVKVMVP